MPPSTSQVDPSSLSDFAIFRRCFLDELAGLFVQVLEVAQAASRLCMLLTVKESTQITWFSLTICGTLQPDYLTS